LFFGFVGVISFSPFKVVPSRLPGSEGGFKELTDPVFFKVSSLLSRKLPRLTSYVFKEVPLVITVTSGISEVAKLSSAKKKRWELDRRHSQIYRRLRSPKVRLRKPKRTWPITIVNLRFSNALTDLPKFNGPHHSELKTLF
jgi:hypothetical protein